MTDSDRTSVAEREVSATTRLATRVMANQLEIAKVTELARMALTVARRGRAVLPLWCLVLAVVIADAELALILLR